MGELGRDIQKDAEQIRRFMAKDFPEIIAVEGLKSIKVNFEREGFVDSRLSKWPERKTTDERGRNITRYRTNRVGRKGSLNQYGRRIKGRKILTGYNTGNNKLRNSYRVRTSPKRVVFYTYKPYAKAHNEGEGALPQRKHIGDSKKRDEAIGKKTTRSLDRIFNK